MDTYWRFREHTEHTEHTGDAASILLSFVFVSVAGTVNMKKGRPPRAT